MPKFLVTYHGAGAPSPEEAQQAMAAFMAWVQSTGDSMVDPGAPLGASRTVTSAGESSESAQGAVAGYTVIEAADLDAAAGLVRTHPFIARGGTLQLWEAMTP